MGSSALTWQHGVAAPFIKRKKPQRSGDVAAKPHPLLIFSSIITISLALALLGCIFHAKE